MKLENVDITKLQLGDLPKFNKCPCELCDDGCFDRAGNKHYPECQRQVPQQSKLSLAARCPLSHYKGSFLAATLPSGGTTQHRRHPCPPPRDNEIPISFKNVPMSGLSSQRDDYQPPPANITKEKMVVPVKQPDHILISRTVPMETKTQYQVEYIEKPVIPVTRRPLHDPIKDSQLYITEPTASIASQTTTRAHFKSWHSAPSQPYTEIPSVAGHVLFPSTNRNFNTTTGSSFLSYPNVSQTKPIVRLEHSGNLKSSGPMDLLTNYRRDYITPEISLIKNNQNETKNLVHEEKVYTRRPMNGISQTSFDFRPYSKHRPPPLAETEPFLSQITIGNSFTPIEKASQYRTDYPGHNASEHPRQPLAAPKDYQQPYVTPMQKMDTLTVTQRDFQPIDINALPRIRLVPLKSSLSVKDQAAPMENMTMTRYHYQPYEPIISTQRYGELMPNVYIRPIDKFQGITTTNETYQGRSGPPARPCIPEGEKIKQGGTHDHNTNYRLDYHPHGWYTSSRPLVTVTKSKKEQTVSAKKRRYSSENEENNDGTSVLHVPTMPIDAKPIKGTNGGVRNKRIKK
ncbi:unnamed protein product [Rotaria sordida]|uniref:Uncharacterized protein n=1 Tax=Rotaria sordida TaxID=392033 RepID=A0A818I2U0_9BILA|nr:unnamed protein product [Rotaria sordida]